MANVVTKARLLVALAITALALVAVPKAASAHSASLACADATHINITNDINIPVTFHFLRADGTEVSTAEVGVALNIILTRTIPTPVGATRWFALWNDNFRQPGSGTTAMPAACTVTAAAPTTTTTAAPTTTTTAAPVAPTTTTTEPATPAPAVSGTDATTTTAAAVSQNNTNSTTKTTTKVGVLGQSASRALPSTGSSNVVPLVVIGSATVFIGGLLLLASRRRDPFTGKLR